MKKIFITGATGFIGHKLIKKLSERDYEITALVRSASQANRIKFKKVNLIVGDLTKPDTYIDKVKNSDIVIHLAAMRSNWGNESDFYKINSKIIKNLFIKNAKTKHIVITSSVYAMGKLRWLPANENHPLNASDIYGKTKKAAEEMTKLMSSETNIPYTLVRPSIVYGKGDNKIAFMSKFIELVKKRRLPVIGSGNNLLHLIHVDDLVNGYLEIIESKPKNQTYILAGMKPITFNELLGIVNKELEYDFKPIRIPKLIIYPFAFVLHLIFKIGFVLAPKLFANEPPISPLKIDTLFGNWHYDISKAQKELSFKPTVDYKKGVADIIVKS